MNALKIMFLTMSVASALVGGAALLVDKPLYTIADILLAIWLKMLSSDEWP